LPELDAELEVLALLVVAAGDELAEVVAAPVAAPVPAGLLLVVTVVATLEAEVELEDDVEFKEAIRGNQLILAEFGGRDDTAICLCESWCGLDIGSCAICLQTLQNTY
jgi:hypothetical protein